MLEKLFSRASEGGLLWLGTPSESHRRLFSEANISLSTMPNSYEALCALETIRLEKHELPVVIVDAEVARRDHHCFAETISQATDYKELHTVLFGKSGDSETLYSQVIFSTRELIKGSNVLIDQQSLYGKSIPDGVHESGRVLVVEKNSTHRLIAKGLLSSLSVEHDIVEDIPNDIDINNYGVVFISQEQYQAPELKWLRAEPEKGEIFGVKRLSDTVMRLRNNTLTESIRGIISEVDQWMSQSVEQDDITVLAIEMVPDVKTARVTVLASDEAVRTLCATVREVVMQVSNNQEVATWIEMAIAEAGNNIVQHGYADGQAGEIRLEAQATKDLVEITLIDFATPYNPLDRKVDFDTWDYTQADEVSAGLGIGIMQSLMDDTSYERVDNSNRLTMRRSL